MIARRTFLSILGGGVVFGVGGVVYSQLPSDKFPTGDPIIQYGQENCARCRMVISDLQYASAWRESDGSETHFDDIGCMVLLDGERHPIGGTQYWVHDFESGEWFDALSASYVVSPDVRSPMGYGVIASTIAAGSKILSGKFSNAEILTWSKLKLTIKDAG